MRNNIVVNDAISGLNSLPEQFAQCLVTSPPYYGLRKYAGNNGLDWPEVQFVPMAGLPSVTVPAWHGNLGEEPTPLMFVGHMVLIFRAAWRVLKDDGVGWVNFGDSYASGGGASIGLKAKDLIGIPWRVAFALQADGWYLRSDIIWHKPNSMPESVTDRCTKAHEYLFMIAKSEKYFYDAEAVKEGISKSTIERWGNDSYTKRDNGYKGTENKPGKGEHTFGVNPSGRNKRTVWTVSTKPLKDAHFAAYPPELIMPCIQAGTSQEGECAECGKAWRRVVERAKQGDSLANPAKINELAINGAIKGGIENRRLGPDVNDTVKTLGWEPQCECAAAVVPQVVIDPFFGAATTGTVCEILGRDWVGVEISAEYAELGTKRMQRERTKRRKAKNAKPVKVAENQIKLFDNKNEENGH